MSLLNTVAGQTITIPVYKDFSLNPILGIVGKDTDPDSRFVQRMIFSPLAMPRTDPLVDSNFVIDYSSSMFILSRCQYLDDATRSWKNIQGRHLTDTDTKATRFRVQLREDLKFSNGTDITAADIVFSYRLAKVTLMEKDNTRNYTNAILQSKLSDLYDVSKVNNTMAEFELTQVKTIPDFINFLAFAPILSYKQFKFQESGLAKPLGDSNDDSNDIYNMKKAWFKDIQNDFEKEPAAYGQYKVKLPIKVSDFVSDNNPTIFLREATLVKNAYWRPNGEEDIFTDNRGSQDIKGWRYAEFSGSPERDTIIIQKDQSVNDDQKRLEPLQSSTAVVMNFPVTLPTVDAYQGTFNDRDIKMEKMYISYKFYGLVYSQNKHGFLDNKVKHFFKNCLNRSALVQSFKTTQRMLESGRPQNYMEYDDKISVGTHYYPFFEGDFVPNAEYDSSVKKMDKLYSILYKDDKSMKYKDEMEEVIKIFLDKIDKGAALDEDEKERRKYWVDVLRGLQFFDGMKEELAEDFEKRKIGSYFTSNYFTVSNGVLILRIIYDVNDSRARDIAGFYRDNLICIFQYLLDERLLPAEIKDFDIRAEKRDYRNLKLESDNSYDIAVYGWNHRFDFLGEFGNFDRSVGAGALRVLYDEMLGSLGNNNALLDGMAKLAEQIDETQIVTTILSLQNCVLYNSSKTEFRNYAMLEDYAMMYPYYWRKTSEIK
jgi:ABC-type transport system substrate-binding protein